MPSGLAFRLQDYLELLDWTGRQLRKGKRGTIEQALPPILDRLNIAPDKWLYSSTHFEHSFKGFVGTYTPWSAPAENSGTNKLPAFRSVCC